MEPASRQILRYVRSSHQSGLFLKTASDVNVDIQQLGLWKVQSAVSPGIGGLMTRLGFLTTLAELEEKTFTVSQSVSHKTAVRRPFLS